MSGRHNLVARALHLVSAGRITVVNDTGPVQLLQVSGPPGSDGSLGVTDGVMRIAQFGFSSSPPLQSEVVLIRLWGNRTLTIAIGTSHQPSRPTGLQAGDSELYDVRGAKIYLGPEGIVIDGAGLPLTVQNVGGEINAPTAVLKCLDAVTTSGISLAKHQHGLDGSAVTTQPIASD